MSVLKFQVPFPPPRRAERTLLPAALTALLGVLLAVQLAAPRPIALPDAGFSRPLRLPPLPVRMPRADPEIALRPLFAPGRRETPVAGTGDKLSALGGARVVGIIAVRGTVRVFVQAADGHVSPVGIGSSYDGWQVIAADPARGVTAVRGAQRATVPVTASAPPRPPRPQTPEEPQEEDQQ